MVADWGLCGSSPFTRCFSEFLKDVFGFCQVVLPCQGLNDQKGCSDFLVRCRGPLRTGPVSGAGAGVSIPSASPAGATHPQPARNGGSRETEGNGGKHEGTQPPRRPCSGCASTLQRDEDSATWNGFWSTGGNPLILPTPSMYHWFRGAGAGGAQGAPRRWSQGIGRFRGRVTITPPNV